MEAIELTFDNNTVIADALKDTTTQHIITVNGDTDINNIKELLRCVSELPEQGFRFFEVRLKALSSENKAEILKFMIKEELCVANLIETLVLLVNSSNNYNPDFFNNPAVFFSSVVDYLDICDALEEETNILREKIVYYFLSIIKSYVNHPRFVLNESSNYEAMPKMYEYMLMLLDFFNISFIMNTPNIKVPEFSEIPSNLKSEIKLLDLWSDKQKFVVSTLSELSQVVMDKINKKDTEGNE